MQTIKEKDETLYQTPGRLPYMAIKKVHDRNFYYAERLGVDSIAFILIKGSNGSNAATFGLTREAKPPFNEREEGNEQMHFKETAFGGSLFDHRRASEYMNLSYDEQLEICKDVVYQECLEEAGYSVNRDQIFLARRVVFNSMSNEYTWLFAVVVSDEDKCEPNPQNEVEAMAKTVWTETDTIDDWILNLECGKTLAIMTAIGANNELAEQIHDKLQG